MNKEKESKVMKLVEEFLNELQDDPIMMMEESAKEAAEMMVAMGVILPENRDGVELLFGENGVFRASLIAIQNGMVPVERISGLFIAIMNNLRVKVEPENDPMRSTTLTAIVLSRIAVFNAQLAGILMDDGVLTLPEALNSIETGLEAFEEAAGEAPNIKMAIDDVMTTVSVILRPFAKSPSRTSVGGKEINARTKS